MDFGRILVTIGAFFEREGLRYAVIGGFALHAYGLSRATFDLDFVAQTEAQPKLLAFLESLGYEALHVSTGYSNHLHRDRPMGRLDFVYVGGETSRLLFDACRTMLRLAGQAFPVPRPEHLAAMKVQVMKNDPTRTLQELADIQFLLRVPGVDEPEVRGYFERAGLLEKYHDLKRLT
jgi:hypothetical protein